MPVAQPDYVRAHRVIRAMAEVEGRDPTRACLLYSLAGSEILRRHFGLEARVVVGAFAMCADVPGLFVLKYGEHSSAGLRSHSRAFHAWIECGGHLIDLLAPLYGQATDLGGHSHEVPARMFQRPLRDAKVSLKELVERGDYWISPNPRLTKLLTKAYLGTRLLSDLVSICSRWFQPKGKRINQRADIHDARGGTRQAILSGSAIKGRW